MLSVSNVCACAISASILLVVANLSLEIYSATSISYMTCKVLLFDAAFVYFCRFFTARVQFRPYYYFRFKIWRHIRIQRTRFLIKRGHFGCATPFSTTFCMLMRQMKMLAAFCHHSKTYINNPSRLCLPVNHACGIPRLRTDHVSLLCSSIPN